MSAKIVRQIINTAKAPAAIGAYSQAVRVDNTLYISGQLGMCPEKMEFVGHNDVAAQARQALTNMKHILEAAGTSFGNVVKCTVLLKDIDDFGKVNDVYSQFLLPPYPARAAYACANLPKHGLVEIEAIAIIGEITDN